MAFSTIQSRPDSREGRTLWSFSAKRATAKVTAAKRRTSPASRPQAAARRHEGATDASMRRAPAVSTAARARWTAREGAGARTGGGASEGASKTGLAGARGAGAGTAACCELDVLVVVGVVVGVLG